MKLRALRLWNVRKFADRGIAIEEIGDGVNVLSAENEFGKSTSFDALHALFFQPFSGTPKAIQSLRPYSGGSPQIEADVETPEGLFRITKQYYSGKHAVVTELSSGRVVAQDDSAEDWIAYRIRGGASGPAGLLWVQQGITEIGGRSSREKDEERKVREDALTSITSGEVELLTGGRRMIRVLNKTVSSLDTLITSTGKPKAGGHYAEALNELDDLQNDEKTLKAQLLELRDALETRRLRKSRLKTTSDPEAVMRREQDQINAKSALEKAEKHSEELAKAKVEEKLAKVNHGSAKTDLETFSEKLKLSAHLAKNISDMEVEYTSAKENRDKATLDDNQNRDQLQLWEKEVDKLRSELEAVRIAKMAQDAAAQLKETESRLEKAEAIVSAIETLKAEQEVLKISDEYLAELDEIERRIEILDASLSAEAVTLKVDYVDENSSRLTRDGLQIESGKTQQIIAPTVFKIPDIGELTVSPGVETGVEEAQDEKRDAQKALRQKLSTLNVKSVLAAKERFHLARKKGSKLASKKEVIAALVPEGIDALRKSCADIKLRALPQPNENTDIDAVDTKLKTAIDSKNTAVQEREMVRAKLHSVQETSIRIEMKLKSAQTDSAQIEMELGPENSRGDNLKTLQENHNKATKELKKAEHGVEKLKVGVPNLENAAAAFKRASSAVERAEKEINELEKEIAGLDGRIAISADQAVEEIFRETKERRITVEQRVDAYEREIATLSRLRQTLENARADAKEQYFGPVMAELKPLLTLLLDEASITFDETTLLPQSLVRNGQDEDISVLSGGMREQLAILTRLAFARLLAKGGDTVPVILDDALVYSDDNRIERMFDALHRQAKDLQILVFTCRQRAFEQLGGNGLRMVEWTPTKS